MQDTVLENHEERIREIERRLERIEEKLNRLIEELKLKEISLPF